MIEAYILIQAETGASQEVADRVGELPGVVSSHAVMGPYDVIAFVQAVDVDEISEVVIRRLHATAGVARTLTCAVTTSNAER